MTIKNLTKAEFLEWLNCRQKGSYTETNACPEGLRRFLKMSKGLTLKAAYNKYKAFRRADYRRRTVKMDLCLGDLCWLPQRASYLADFSYNKKIRALSRKILKFIRENG